MITGLRIVHCFRSPVGGIFRHVRDLVSAQSRKGHHCGIVCDSTTGGTFEDELFSELMPLLSLGLQRVPMQRHIGIGDLSAGWRTYDAIRKLQPDVIHGHGAKGGFYARVFGSLLRVSGSRVARLYSPHGGSLHYNAGSLTGKAIFLVERLAQNHSDQILFVSEYERDAYCRKIGAPRTGASVVYNGVRPEEFKPVKKEKNAADFLYVGMMRDLKGPDLFIDALRAAEGLTGKNLRAVMVGDGSEVEKYRKQAAALGFGERIKFLPAMAARKAFALGRVIVVPSRAEAMPYIVLEALASGMPMIATRVGGIPEIFGCRKDVLCLPESASIAEAMALAVTEPETYRAKMPEKKILQARFSIEQMASAIEDVYGKALASL